VFPLKDNIPTERLPIVTIALIVANVLMYFLFQKGGLSFGSPSSPRYTSNLIDWAAIPYEFSNFGDQCRAAGENLRCGPGGAGQPGAIATAFTAMFMHGGLLHLGGNMLFLWIFGNNVEDRMGRVKYLLFYLLGGLAALAAQVAIDPQSAVPTIGASGAVAGVLGGYILLYPRARVLTAIFLVVIFTIVELPALLILGFWFLQQVLFGYFNLNDPQGGGGGVAYFAHIGGFVFGMIAVHLFARSRRAREQPLF
jgi:membrane associated rhomboid family serine protease